ncbi:Phosphatidylinositol transfer protein CSR1 [Nakaseomyces bracarensis]|uniref:Phosphatidylinositol transfer protein CSR1 n=1 Tax=Nakaseomyces bracarensis TaxID=273131 RepID=A0ABR4NXH5_9SACH
MTTDTESMRSKSKDEKWKSSIAPLEREVVVPPDQEHSLKQIWVYLLHLWNIPVDGSIVFKDIRHQEISELASGVSNLSASDKGKKKSSFWGRKSASSTEVNVNPKDESEHGIHHARHSATPYVKGNVHPEFKMMELEPESSYKEFWESLRIEPPDAILVRFLKARKWHMDKTLHMLAKDINWRCTNDFDINGIINGGEVAMVKNDVKGVVKNIELQKAIIAGKDLEGRPIILVRPKVHYSSDQTEEELEKYALLVIEQSKLFLKPPHLKQAGILFDLTGFSLSNMDYTPVKFLITCFEAHYPESLGHLFIHKAPWIFSPIWNIVKNWLDPVVASKIMFTKNVDELSKYMAKDQIPEYLGGTLKLNLDKYDMPDGSKDELLKDTATRDKLLVEREELIQEFLKRTAEWIETDPADKEKHDLVRNKRAQLSEKIDNNYIALDPYIRSRSAYDIRGELKV